MLIFAVLFVGYSHWHLCIVLNWESFTLILAVLLCHHLCYNWMAALCFGVVRLSVHSIVCAPPLANIVTEITYDLRMPG